MLLFYSILFQIMYSWSEIVYLYGAGNCLVFTLTIHSLAKFKIALILSVQLFGKPSFTKTHHQGVSGVCDILFRKIFQKINIRSEKLL